MIYIVCLTCKSALRIMGDSREIEHLVGRICEWYPSSYPCWTDNCVGRAQFLERIDADVVRRIEVRDLTPQEAFLALNGMGMPDEKDCSAAAVKQVFESSPVKYVDAVQIRDSHRSIVNYIEMENGTRIYLASGPEGAIVYRISRPHSYTQEVLHEADARTSA